MFGIGLSVILSSRTSQDIRNIFKFVVKLFYFAIDSAIKLAALCSFYGRCRRMNKLSHQQIQSFKIDVDHLNFTVAASNEKLACLNASLPIYWIIGLPTNIDSVTKALLSFFHLFDVLQTCAIKLESKN